MTTATIPFRPFSSGTQAADWFHRNCDGCTKAGDPGVAGSSECDLFEAIHDSACGDEYVTPEQAQRVGYEPESGNYTWACTEFKPTPEHTAEQRRRSMLREITPDERAAMLEKGDEDIERLLVIYDECMRMLSSKNGTISQLRSVIADAASELEEYGVPGGAFDDDVPTHPLFDTWLQLHIYKS